MQSVRLDTSEVTVSYLLSSRLVFSGDDWDVLDGVFRLLEDSFFSSLLGVFAEDSLCVHGNYNIKIRERAKEYYNENT